MKKNIHYVNITWCLDIKVILKQENMILQLPDFPGLEELHLMCTEELLMWKCAVIGRHEKWVRQDFEFPDFDPFMAPFWKYKNITDL